MSREAWSAVLSPHARRPQPCWPANSPTPRSRPSPSTRTQPKLPGNATAIEIAAVMARLHSPLVAVVDDGLLLGMITIGRLLDRLL